MSKTIDVMEGDRFERIQTTVYQFRDGKCRGISEWKIDDWWKDRADTYDEYLIDSSVAAKSFLSWGYTITPAAKPEAKPADVPATVKPDLTVPLVDAWWVEETSPVGPNKRLVAFPTMEDAETGRHFGVNGGSRIVRIRNDDEKARFLANHANERLDRHANRLAEAHDRIDALESRLAALEKPADKPAARVVKAPKADGMHTPVWWQGWRDADAAWRAAIAAVGVEYKESDNG